MFGDCGWLEAVARRSVARAGLRRRRSSCVHGCIGRHTQPSSRSLERATGWAASPRLRPHVLRGRRRGLSPGARVSKPCRTGGSPAGCGRRSHLSRAGIAACRDRSGSDRARLEPLPRNRGQVARSFTRPMLGGRAQRFVLGWAVRPGNRPGLAGRGSPLEHGRPSPARDCGQRRRTRSPPRRTPASTARFAHSRP